MSRLQRALRLASDFVIGDDPAVALAVTAGLGLTAAIAAADVSAWWVMPVVVAGALAASVTRAARRRRPARRRAGEGLSRDAPVPPHR